MTKRIGATAVAISMMLLLAGCSQTGSEASAAEEAAAQSPGPASVEEAHHEEGDALLDWCRPHALPESKCTKCNPGLVDAFKATGDWCPEHGFPESVCPICNPVPLPAEIAGDWCAEHALPESKCTKCNPKLVDAFKVTGDWCPEHGFPESVCPICNPATPPTGAAPDWCVEHALPESKCTKCNPELVDAFKVTGDWCPEHGFPESVCPLCNPATPPAGVSDSAIAPGTRIRFRSQEIERAAGIEVVTAREASLDEGVACTARIDFDRNAVADVRAPVPGIVREVRVDLGDTVEAGTPLFVLESGSVGELQARLTSARQRVEVARAEAARQEELRSSRISSVRQLEVARQELDAARADLEALELSLRFAGAPEAAPVGRYEIRSPVAGRVTRRPGTVGTYATAEVSLATIADTDRMWALLDVPSSDAGSVALGQAVTIEVEGVGDPTFVGTITWVSAEVDPRTRTVAARAEVDNLEGRLRANQFARAVIQVSAPEAALTVPSSAVQRLGEERLIFVRTGDGIYEPRAITIGRRHEDRVQVIGRLASGDPVVTAGAFLLKTELSKESIGAGCCEVEAPTGTN